MADPRVRRAFDRAANSYAAAAGVQRATLDALVEALPPDLGQPAPRILDVGCGTGLAFGPLLRRYPDARLVGVDFAEAMLRASDRHDVQKTGADAVRLPFRDACADLVFSSMTWQWCPLPAVLAEARRVLRPGGTLAFTTLTAGTFDELAHAFAGIDGHPHTLALLERAAVLDAVVAAGFGRVGHRATTRVARYPDVRTALGAIRATGASEVGGRRRPGLLGKTAWRTIEARYRERADAAGRLPLSYEVLEVVAAR